MAGRGIREVLESACSRLAPEHESARADAEILLAFVRGRPRHEPYGFAEREVDERSLRRYQALIERRLAGEPVAYLVGEREFWSLSLKLTADTLVPRPETERLVELALEALPVKGGCRIAELGTGCGAIALALGCERPDDEVVATDVSKPALEVAKANALRLGVANVAFRAGHWCEPLAGERFDIIVSNPPYVANGDPLLERSDLRYEPALALVGGVDGLCAIEEIARSARWSLRPDATIVIEHGVDQQSAVAGLFEHYGYRNVRTFRDAAGLPRVCVADSPG